jgi:hypothetical protein
LSSSPPPGRYCGPELGSKKQRASGNERESAGNSDESLIVPNNWGEKEEKRITTKAKEWRMVERKRLTLRPGLILGVTQPLGDRSSASAQRRGVRIGAQWTNLESGCVMRPPRAKFGVSAHDFDWTDDWCVKMALSSKDLLQVREA